MEAEKVFLKSSYIIRVCKTFLCFLQFNFNIISIFRSIKWLSYVEKEETNENGGRKNASITELAIHPFNFCSNASNYPSLCFSLLQFHGRVTRKGINMMKVYGSHWSFHGLSKAFLFKIVRNLVKKDLV